jgi:hypothetical protein
MPSAGVSRFGRETPLEKVRQNISDRIFLSYEGRPADGIVVLARRGIFCIIEIFCMRLFVLSVWNIRTFSGGVPRTVYGEFTVITEGTIDR